MNCSLEVIEAIPFLFLREGWGIRVRVGEYNSRQAFLMKDSNLEVDYLFVCLKSVFVSSEETLLLKVSLSQSPQESNFISTLLAKFVGGTSRLKAVLSFSPESPNNPSSLNVVYSCALEEEYLAIEDIVHLEHWDLFKYLKAQLQHIYLEIDGYEKAKEKIELVVEKKKREEVIEYLEKHGIPEEYKKK